MKLSHCDRVY